MSLIARSVLLSCCTAAAAAAAAQGAPAAPERALAVASSKAHGAYLTDAQGRALYLLEGEGKPGDRCGKACAVVWPPLLAGQDEPAEPAARDAVKKELIGTGKRPDGSLQVTYDGHPLYYYVKDRGQGRAAERGFPLQCLQRGLENLCRAVLERERKPRSERCASGASEGIGHGVGLAADRVVGDECVIGAPREARPSVVLTTAARHNSGYTPGYSRRPRLGA